MREHGSTTERTLVIGRPIRYGLEHPYFGFDEAPGEAHGVRADLVPGAVVGPGRPLLRSAHLTDLHIADTQSPLRLDFAAKTAIERPGWGGAATYAFRANELLTSHAVAAMVETLSRLELDVAVLTGDSVDNAQFNEVEVYLSVMDGGVVRPVSAGGVYHGPQSPGWGDPWYWVPETGDSRYQRLWGYPTLPQVIPAASKPFDSPGVGAPWLACLGNHDALVGGTTAPSRDLSLIATGDSKPVALPDGIVAGEELTTFLARPSAIFSGPAREVSPDPERHLVDTAGYVAAHRAREGGPGPAGHGFTESNQDTGTGYFRHDPAPGVCILVLDTNHREGMWDGSIDREQLSWLADELRALTGPDQPVVILASHHGTPSMGNGYGICPDSPAGVAYAAELLEVALSCPNVVLWLNGHHHANRIVAHHRRGGGGLFEVTTASMTDYPTQARVLELIQQDDGVLRITSTIVDHGAPLDPGPEPTDVAELASLHRQLAANDVWRGGARYGLGGTPVDRNVHLMVPLSG
ncbi:hypothetical protein G1H11_22205 [Phytoactinopolyspora alkaliphila]|uniref:Uncharacterized protein n=1 Tax=Phytoactinopolyspora alkaliphila TaxID=1783498 RepID=A0A6N9YST0_9ACTN|nr:metallophosphoesterase [Phytoactinopolyspora alkaliphila]NED98015.1 hypothetical protein [Phytoactinopolyspora alkaliphila]